MFYPYPTDTGEFLPIASGFGAHFGHGVRITTPATAQRTNAVEVSTTSIFTNDPRVQDIGKLFLGEPRMTTATGVAAACFVPSHIKPRTAGFFLVSTINPV